ncbi:Nn.00g045530.m01.CDS01 [Neocucurbitaria sp. VM-36]
MPPLRGFSDNPFTTHADFKTASLALLRVLKQYQSKGGARIRLPLVTGTHFDDVAAQLEGYARPLWAVGTLMHSDIVSKAEYNELIQPYVEGLANGTNPDHVEYWGPVVLRDQRMVEMEIISFALLSAPNIMFRSQTQDAKQNITKWLKTINGKDFPTTNWLWFRVMTNLALTKVCGVPQDEVLEDMKVDLDLMERFYLDKGWAADGIWNDQGRQADYYSGSFAIQFSQLIYVKMAQDIDPERCERFRNRAINFASSFCHYFDSNGAAIPFGRSLTYRFAFAGFWSAIAFAEIELPHQLKDPGIIRGLLLRHFRWWSDKHDIFNIDGTLTIGFTYPNMYMSEDYNSPQSPYWAMKSFLALALPETHPFWTADEKPFSISSNAIVPLQPPLHILCNGANHHFLLSMGQFCPWPLKATEAKYGKFAYSSHFGFSVPTGPLIQQIAPDSTLALSKDGGDTWRVPWKVGGDHLVLGNIELCYNDDILETVPTLSSVWHPWVDANIEVITYLIAPSKRWPDWYVRWHKITNKGSSNVNIIAVQGGFAIQGREHELGQPLPACTDVHSLLGGDARQSHGFPEGTLQTGDGSLICSNAGASGIRSINIDPGIHGDAPSIEGMQPEVLKPDANTNLMWQRTLIPTIKLEMHSTSQTVEFGSAVFALSRTKDIEDRYGRLDVAKLWNDVPIVSMKVGMNDVREKHYIVLG